MTTTPNTNPQAALAKLQRGLTALRLEVPEAVADSMKAIGDDVVAAFASLTEQRDQLEVQLAGCLTVAEGCTAPDLVAKKGDYGWSPAYEETLRLRRHYNRTRAERPRICIVLDELLNAQAVPEGQSPALECQIMVRGQGAFAGVIAATDTMAVYKMMTPGKNTRNEPVMVEVFLAADDIIGVAIHRPDTKPSGIWTPPPR